MNDDERMNIVKAFPPNYAKVRKAFPEIRGRQIVFCWGNKIYNPSGGEVMEHIVVHEMVHRKQQGDKIEEWWDKYLADKQFRFDQELEAYATQYAFAKPLLNTKGIALFLGVIATDLSGSMYGNLVPYEKAATMIRHKADTLSPTSK